MKELTAAALRESVTKDGREAYELKSDWAKDDWIRDFIFECLRCKSSFNKQKCDNCEAYWHMGSGEDVRPLRCDECDNAHSSWTCPKCQCVNPALRTAFAVCKKPGAIATGVSAFQHLGCALLIGLVGLVLVGKVWILGVPLLLFGFGAAIALLVQLAKGTYRP